MKKLTSFILSCFVTVSPLIAAEQSPNDCIKLNQVGYYPSQEKVIVIEGTNTKSVKVTNEEGKVLLKARKIAQTTSPISGKKRSTFDISSLSKPGSYYVVSGKQRVQFVVAESALSSLADASIKSFYFQRTGMAIDATYAGKWSRPAAHLDTNVLVHPAAATTTRPEGTVISSPKGWYDAGDYNKYVVNSAFSMGLMLAMYELVPLQFASQNINIPESSNSTPDLLDEIMWNLEWLFTMQDYDGGAYHKLTTPNFEGFVKPVDCKQQRYVTQKSTCATLDFAAVMAKCARLYDGNKDYPDVSVRCLNAARAAYLWAKKNPRVFYNQNELNKNFKPQVNTGTYGDGSANDEFFWAATEMYLATGEQEYLSDAEKYAPKSFSTPSWAGVSSLGTFALASAKNISKEAQQLKEQQCKNILDYASGVTNFNVVNTAFYSPYGNSAKDFFWGCNSEGSGVQGVSLLFAYALSGDKKYLTNALRDVDYILGRNATGYCYVTGFGQKSPMHPHHRLSDSDGIDEPIPGLLVGGPNPGQQDKPDCSYDSDYADESYMDVTSSYASNEIAINWSATLVALVNGIEYYMHN